jgi:pimeloyl-ACP methyl ester carboxylesterase
MGYGKINVWAGSWGTRAVLFYLKLHPGSIRSAIIEGVAPPSLKNPLPHARAAQDGVDSLFAACGRQPDCHAAYPNLEGDLAAVLKRLHEKPTTVIVPNGEHADTTELRWQQFAEALRVTSYYVPAVLMVPRLVHHAADGELTPFALAGISANRGLRTQLRFGLLLSVTCSEDVPRIGESEIASATRGTYLGDSRVREQMEACKLWPHASLPAGYGDPIRSDVPVFLLSGEWDPVSTAADGEDAAKYLSNAIHVIAPGVHVPGGPCVVAMEQAFLAGASPRVVDKSCVAAMKMPPFAVDKLTP